jgi:hypothetical protein
VTDDIVRIGDACLFAWGDAKRHGLIEAIVTGRLDAQAERIPRASGSHTDPTLARLLSAESQGVQVVLAIDNEITKWRSDRHMKLWADVVTIVYVERGQPTNRDCARRLGVSARTVELVRSQARRMILLCTASSGLIRMFGQKDSAAALLQAKAS